MGEGRTTGKRSNTSSPQAARFLRHHRAYLMTPPLLVVLLLMSTGLILAARAAGRAAGDRDTGPVARNDIPGQVYAWGDNAAGQLGTGDRTPHLMPVPVPGLTRAIAVAAGGYQSLALEADGTVVAWGGDIAAASSHSTTPARQGSSHTLIPAPVPGLTHISAIAAGLGFGLALRRDGTVAAFGANDANQLGDGTTDAHDIPMTVPGLSGVVAIAAKGAQGLALTRGGAVYTWGSFADGATTRRVPTRVAGLPAVVAITAGLNDDLALTRGGAVYVWGDGVSGGAPYPPISVPGHGRVEAIAAGADTPDDTRALAVLASGTVEVRDQGSDPVPVAGLPPVARITVGEPDLPSNAAATFAWGRDGLLWAWGGNEDGQLGDGTSGKATNRARPLPVAVLNGVVAVAAGAAHALAIDTQREGSHARTMSATVTAVVTGYRAPIVATANAAAAGDAYTRARAGAVATVGPVAAPGPATVSGTPPVRQPLLPSGSGATVARCGQGDLDIGHGAVVQLGGARHYGRVCVHDRGIVVVDGGLTLRARTIDVDRTSAILADGTTAALLHPARTGCASGRSTLRPGAPGPAGDPKRRGETAEGSDDGAGGPGGGTVTLVAARIVLNGVVAARGAPGQRGYSARCADEADCPAAGDGGGGGGGGGIRLVARDLQVGGHMSVEGAGGGPPGTSISNQYGSGPRGRAGPAGATGCVVLLATVLRARPGPLPIVGEALLGRPQPDDVIPLAATPSS